MKDAKTKMSKGNLKIQAIKIRKLPSMKTGVKAGTCKNRYGGGL